MPLGVRPDLQKILVLLRFPAHLVPQRSNLFYVMQSVNQVELSPLRSGEWAEEGMVDNFHARTEFLLTPSNGLIHFGDFGGNFRCDLLRGKAAGLSLGRRFSP